MGKWLGSKAPISCPTRMRYNPQFLLSALSAAQFPAPAVPEIAFLGRSNVGKSSLLNALVGDRTAKVSSTPGRTRAINFFLLSDERQRPRLGFADLPGYGYAKISKSISAEWPQFIEPYLAERETLRLCICLVDSNIPPQPSDRQLVDWLRAAGRGFAVVATKIDRLSGNQRTRNLRALREAMELDEVLPVSAKTKQGISELWTRIEAAGADPA
ncbi:MAG TPA: ribosome biogenesis GTP-binding protein YihA/YsxC [Terracidiphilus sp.]|nr:ribosome biogenesis GTP-binding protein YihA/YsxC [Terracidiphilus sp.]